MKQWFYLFERGDPQKIFKKQQVTKYTMPAFSKLRLNLLSQGPKTNWIDYFMSYFQYVCTFATSMRLSYSHKRKTNWSQKRRR